MIETTSTESPAGMLARSLFGFLFIALIPAVITWVALLLSPVPSEENFVHIRTATILGFGLFTLALLVTAIVVFRTSVDKLGLISRIIAGLLGNTVFAIFIIVLLIEVNIVAFLTLTYVAPTITGPFKFLLVCWSLILIGIIFAVNLGKLQAFLARTGELWRTTGILVTLVVLFGGVYIITNMLVQASGLQMRLQGGLDTRKLEFFDDGNTPTPSEFWAEQSQTRVRWLPYLYWTVEPFDGRFIHVDENGLRYTPSYTTEGNDYEKIYFFGGSTMWGEGARDAYTIPGHVARLLSEQDAPEIVINYGQTGYVSTQDMMMFQMQLANDNVPDVAVFYQGFNDIYSAYTQDITGIPYQEVQRVNDAEAGRMLRNGQPVLRGPSISIEAYNWSLVGENGAVAAAIVDRWLANVRITEAVARDYGIQTLFIWQPALLYKSTLVGDETVIRQRIDDENPGFADLYLAVDAELREQLASTPADNIIILSDLFEEDTRAIFHDLVHITEQGNLAVVEAILPALREQIDK